MVTVTSAGGLASLNFTVSRTQAVAAPTLSAMLPSSAVNAGTTRPYSPPLTLSGTNLDVATSIAWYLQGSLVTTWSRQSNGSWTNPAGGVVTVTQAAASLGVAPTVVSANDTWTGTQNWMVKVTSAGGTASWSFTVSRNN